MKILVLDNYDSFTYNLVHMVRELGYGDRLEVHRNDQITLEEAGTFDKIILSPGPGIPSEAGIMPALLGRYGREKHIFGVCLGHQAIAEAFGGELYNMPEVLHGVETGVQVTAPEDPLFRGVPSTFSIGRYHSWAVKPGNLPGQIQVLAVDRHGEIMALRLADSPVFGVQFHPESIITDHGMKMLKNFLELPVHREQAPAPPEDIDMKQVLNHLLAHGTLDYAEAKAVLSKIARGEVNPAQVSAFLTVYLMRDITVEELGGFREAMLELCIPVPLDEFDPIDLCGTGGDGKDTFNISTLASFVAAGAGVKVAKHGNYGISSVSGSSNVMEQLGFRFQTETGALKRQIEEAGICFLHAPLFHPAMKHVAPIRKELGIKTFFNMLGPMVNPAFPRNQMVGVFSLELARLYGYLYQQTDKQFTIVHALDGYDELSLTGAARLIDRSGERLMSPADLGFRPVAAAELHGGATVKEAVDIFLSVLKGNGSQAQVSVVLANAGLAIKTARPGLSLEEAVAQARESLDSGRAMASLQRLLALQEASLV